MTTSEQLLVRLLKEKHKTLISNVDTLLRVLVGEEVQSKKLHAEYTLTAAKDLRGILSSQDVPDWLNVLLGVLPSFLNARVNNADLLISIIPLKQSIDSHQWSLDGNTTIAFDFDAIYEHFKKESRLPELFDQILRILEEIHASGEIDSITMITALGKAISTIKRCKDGSYFSLNSAWDFLISFLKNYLWGELSNLPVLGTAMSALRATIEQLNDEMFSLHSKIQSELEKTVGAEIKRLEGKASFPSVTYDKSGYTLPKLSVPLLPDTTA